MEQRNTKRMLCLLLIAAMALSITGCAAKTQAADLMVGIGSTVATGTQAKPTASQQAANMDFALRLFRTANEPEKNTLLSPLSVSIALAMTANGAKGETRAQMESILGMSVDELNAYYLALRAGLESNETLRLANSIWFKNAVDPSFLQTNADYYGAGAFQAPFDETTLEDINNWVKEKTHGMIPEILDQIPTNAVMYLVNALAFVGKWEEGYEPNDVRKGIFTCAKGTERSVEYLWSSETQYLQSPQATGFVKPYKGGRYAFVALLPREDLSPEALLMELDGGALQALLAEPQAERVNAAIPKFEAQYSVELSSVLKQMGMELPFDGTRADFSGIGGCADCISRVMHKTFLSVDEAGTKAAAATVVEMVELCAEIEPEKQVILDRPFVYMLLDTQLQLPLFIGTMLDPS